MKRFPFTGTRFHANTAPRGGEGTGQSADSAHKLCSFLSRTIHLNRWAQTSRLAVSTRPGFAPELLIGWLYYCMQIRSGLQPVGERLALVWLSRHGVRGEAAFRGAVHYTGAETRISRQLTVGGNAQTPGTLYSLTKTGLDLLRTS